MLEYKEWLTEFGSRLRAERERQKLTRRELADRASTAQDYIAQLERGDKSPSLQTLVNIIMALDISADVLIFDNTKESQGEIDLIIRDFAVFLKGIRTEEAVALYEINKFLFPQPCHIIVTGLFSCPFGRSCHAMATVHKHRNITQSS